MKYRNPTSIKLPLTVKRIKLQFIEGTLEVDSKALYVEKVEDLNAALIAAHAVIKAISQK